MVMPQLVLIPPGEFVMEDARTHSRRPVVVEPFHLAATQVTRDQFIHASSDRPDTAGATNIPVCEVSWWDAVNWCNAASAREGIAAAYEIRDDSVRWRLEADGYRLPTEAEWEWACRARVTGPRYGPVGDVAWTEQDGLDGPAPVATKQPNTFGLYDMLGNVWEWCWDYADPARYADYRSLRGGGWADKPWSCRASVRRGSFPSARLDDVGFRLARGAVGWPDATEAQGWAHARDIARANISGPLPMGWTPLREITKLHRTGGPDLGTR